MEWLADTQWSIALHESIWVYPVIETIHVLTLCLFVGMSVMWDLRLLGIMFGRVPVSDVSNRLMPWMKLGFVVMLVSGAALFYAIPVRTYQNVFFRAKVVFLVLAGLNALIFHRGIQKRVVQWDTVAVPPRTARIAGATSLLLWLLIILTGRLIAYNWFDCRQIERGLMYSLSGCTTDTN
jgi:hypothetical protein